MDLKSILLILGRDCRGREGDSRSETLKLFINKYSFMVGEESPSKYQNTYDLLIFLLKKNDLGRMGRTYFNRCVKEMKKKRKGKDELSDRELKKRKGEELKKKKKNEITFPFGAEGISGNDCSISVELKPNEYVRSWYQLEYPERRQEAIKSPFDKAHDDDGILGNLHITSLKQIAFFNSLSETKDGEPFLHPAIFILFPRVSLKLLTFPSLPTSHSLISIETSTL